MSKVLKEYTDLQLVQEMEKKWGDELSYITPVEGGTKEDKREFRCVFGNTEADLQISHDGWVTIKGDNSKFWDVMGTIK